MVLGEILVAVPIAPRKTVVRPAPNLHKTHASFQQPARDQAARPEIFGDLLIDAVKFFGRLGLAGKIERFRRSELKAGSHFERSNSRFETRIAGARLQM